MVRAIDRNRPAERPPTRNHNNPQPDPARRRRLPCRRAFADQNLASTARSYEKPWRQALNARRSLPPRTSPCFLQPIRNQHLRITAGLEVAGVARHQRQAMRTCNRGLNRIGKLPARAAAKASRIVCDFHGHR